MHAVRVAFKIRYIDPDNGGIRSLVVGDNERLLSPVTCVKPLSHGRGGDPLGSIIRRLRIKSLKAQIEASRLYCASLVNELKSVQTDMEKTRITICYNDALRQNHTLQLLLDWLERKEREQPKAQGC